MKTRPKSLILQGWYTQNSAFLDSSDVKYKYDNTIIFYEKYFNLWIYEKMKELAGFVISKLSSFFLGKQPN